jgi:hypothetical protein
LPSKEHLNKFGSTSREFSSAYYIKKLKISKKKRVSNINLKEAPKKIRQNVSIKTAA